jgi:hypothetical protein
VNAAAAIVRFHVFGVHDASLSEVADRIGDVLRIRLRPSFGSVRGLYYRWSDSSGADVLVQSVAPDEAELLGVLPATCLVYTTDLDEAGYRALGDLPDLHLLDADVLPAALLSQPLTRHSR